MILRLLISWVLMIEMIVLNKLHKLYVLFMISLCFWLKWFLLRGILRHADALFALIVFLLLMLDQKYLGHLEFRIWELIYITLLVALRFSFDILGLYCFYSDWGYLCFKPGSNVLIEFKAWFGLIKSWSEGVSRLAVKFQVEIDPLVRISW